MNGQRFIDLAGVLAVNPTFGDTAARNRTAISRAYYGVFHCAVELLAEIGVDVPENHTGHQAAYTSLFSTAVPKAKEAARLLNDLRGERNRADYHLSNAVPENTENAKQCVESAHDFCACAADCLKEPIRTKLVASFSQ